MIMSSTKVPQNSRPRNGFGRRWHSTVVLAGLFMIVLFGLVALAIATGWQETWAQITKLGALEIALLLALSLANYTLRGLRWHIFTRRLGMATSMVQSLRNYFGGFAMTATPGRVGELIRMRWFRRETGWHFEKTAPLMLVDRSSDLAALAVILGGALALSSSGIAGALPVTVLALAATLVATRPRLLAGSASLTYRMLGRWPRIFARVRSAARSLEKFSNPTMMLFAVLMGVLSWFAEVFAFFLLLNWLGADVSLPIAAAIFVFSTIAGGLTGAPGGVGGAEAAMVALLTLEGVPMELSLPATAIIRVTTLWFAIGLGLVVFPFAERISKRAEDAMENN